MFEALAIICSIFFLLSFMLLFKKPLSKFFSFLFSPITKSLAKKRKEKRDKQERLRSTVIPKLASAVPYQKISPPLPESDLTSAEDPEKEELNNDNSPYNLAKERLKSIQNQTREAIGNDEAKSQIQSELHRISKSNAQIDFGKISPENISRLPRFNQDAYLPPFIKTRLESDESAILAKRKQFQSPKSQSPKSFSKRKSGAAEVEIDGEKIDLSKLPPNIKKLLLSGILDKKDF